MFCIAHCSGETSSILAVILDDDDPSTASNISALLIAGHERLVTGILRGILPSLKAMNFRNQDAAVLWMELLFGIMGPSSFASGTAKFGPWTWVAPSRMKL